MHPWGEAEIKKHAQRKTLYRDVKRERERLFTMLELLVVISIICTLMSLLLPALGKAKAAVRETQCRGNLKQLIAATMMYADTYQSWLPTADTPPWRVDGAWQKVWYQRVMPFCNDNINFLICSEAFAQGETWTTASWLSREYLLVKGRDVPLNYGAVATVFGYPEAISYSVNYTPNRLDQVRLPATTTGISDSAGVYMYIPNNLSNIKYFRHHRNMYMAFMDGHVGAIRLNSNYNADYIWKLH